MSVSVRKTGFDMMALSRRVRGNIAGVMNEGAESFVSLRKQLAPKDTGWMAEQTRQEEVATPDHLRVTMICDSSNNPHRGGNNQAYDEMVEYGTIDSEAQPSATPAFELAKKQVNERLRGVLR